MRPSKSTSLLLALAAVAGLAGFTGPKAMPTGVRWERYLTRQWYDPAKVEAAQVKRERRQIRNLRIADAGGIGMIHG